jgi:hypothetical protein
VSDEVAAPESGQPATIGRFIQVAVAQTSIVDAPVVGVVGEAYFATPRIRNGMAHVALGGRRWQIPAAFGGPGGSQMLQAILVIANGLGNGALGLAGVERSKWWNRRRLARRLSAPSAAGADTRIPIVSDEQSARIVRETRALALAGRIAPESADQLAELVRAMLKEARSAHRVGQLDQEG